MTGAHRRPGQDPVRFALKSVLLAGFIAASLAIVGIFAYLLATDSKYLLIIAMALQGFLAITYARRLAVKVLRNRTPSPVILADWIGDLALVIAWVAAALASFGQIQGWMHGAFEYAMDSSFGLLLVGMPAYWWRGQRRVVLALTARAVAGRWPWSAGG
jgi:hypothetical protein